MKLLDSERRLVVIPWKILSHHTATTALTKALINDQSEQGSSTVFKELCPGAFLFTHDDRN
jgi:hypothetical protein